MNSLINSLNDFSVKIDKMFIDLGYFSVSSTGTKKLTEKGFLFLMYLLFLKEKIENE